MSRPFRPLLGQANFISLFGLTLLSTLWILVISADQASASTVAQVGIDSNFVMVDDKVFFAQADGTLTVLDLTTGGVLERLIGTDYSGALRQIDEGILAWGYSSVTLVDLDGLAPRWSVAKPNGVRISQHLETILCSQR